MKPVVPYQSSSSDCLKNIRGIISASFAFLLFVLLFGACVQIETLEGVMVNEETQTSNFKTGFFETSTAIAQRIIDVLRYTRTPTVTATLNQTEQINATLEEAYQQTRDASWKATVTTFYSIPTPPNEDCKTEELLTLISLDGEWEATNCTFFQIMNKEESIIWQPPLRDFLAEDWGRSVNPQQRVQGIPLYWTKNDNYLYFSIYAGSADSGQMSNANSLYRIDVQTGKTTRIIQSNFNYFSFSPDDHHILQVPDDIPGGTVFIKIVDIETGHSFVVKVDGYEQATNAYWRSDGKAVAISVYSRSTYLYQREFASAILVLDIMKESSKLVYKDDINYLEVINWSSNGIITIRLSNYESGGEVASYLFYDVESGKFVQPFIQP
jgi:hypothetical protein